MFDIVTARQQVADYFYKQLYRYGNKEALQSLIQRWVQLLAEYSQYEHFIAFEPKLPLLQLKPNAVGVLVVPFPSTKISLSYLPITVIPLYPFRIQLKHSRISSKEGLEILHLYLNLTNVQIIGFFKVPNDMHLISELKKSYPKAHIYGRRSFGSFLSVCRLKVKKAETTHSLKSQTLARNHQAGMPSKQEELISNLTRNDNE